MSPGTQCNSWSRHHVVCIQIHALPLHAFSFKFLPMLLLSLNGCSFKAGHAAEAERCEDGKEIEAGALGEAFAAAGGIETTFGA